MTRHTRRIAAACALGAAAVAAQAETTPYYIGGYVGYTHLSNALGLADGAPVPTNLGYTSKADDVTTIALVGGLDQRIGRQRVFGDLTLRDNRYADNKRLNSQTYAASAGLDWETVERISGNVALRSNRELIRYGAFDQPTDVRNLVTANQVDANVRVGVVTRFTFEGGAGWRNVDYTDPSYAGREYRQRHVSAGVRYWPGGSNYLGLTLRESDGRYPRYTASSAETFDRRDVTLSLGYALSGLTSISARASHTRVDYSTAPLDFSGVTGSLRVAYVPTAKLRLEAEAARDRAQDLRFSFIEFDPNVGFFRENLESADLATALRLRAAYAVTSKVAINAQAGTTRRNVALLTTGQQGRERTSSASLGASWTPTRTSRVGCDWSQDRRRSDLLADRLNTSTSSFGCYGQLTIQP
jgi:hypothetical protein